MARVQAGERFRLGDVGMLVRSKAFGFTMAMPLLGAGTVSAGISIGEALVLLGIAVTFHAFAYVLNDVIDLPVDRSQPLRAQDPLVRGTITRRQALVFALAQVPLAMAFAAVSGDGATACAVLGVGFILMVVYNVWGKRCIFPPLTDAIQGFAWAALSLIGALIAGGTPNALTGVVVAFLVVFIIMMNSVHGSLRDLENDIKCGLRTTAIMLSAKPRPAGGIILPRSFIAYTLALQAILLALPLLSLAFNWFDFGPLSQVVTAVAVLVAGGLCLALLVVAARSTANAGALFVSGSLHLVLSFASLIVLFALYITPALLALILAVYFGPLLTTALLRRALKSLRRKTG
ncbi:MAG TPA: UbiA family prenyltransferase [Chloroflexia bacterium]|jgi:4-hydroxybenzoate polyprenyltransferase